MLPFSPHCLPQRLIFLYCLVRTTIHNHIRAFLQTIYFYIAFQLPTNFYNRVFSKAFFHLSRRKRTPLTSSPSRERSLRCVSHATSSIFSNFLSPSLRVNNVFQKAEFYSCSNILNLVKCLIQTGNRLVFQQEYDSHCSLLSRPRAHKHEPYISDTRKLVTEFRILVSAFVLLLVLLIFMKLGFSKWISVIFQM